ncbi:MAG: cytochrome c oxidase subunit 3 [Acidobacteriota bacterium]
MATTFTTPEPVVQTPLLPGDGGNGFHNNGGGNNGDRRPSTSDNDKKYHLAIWFLMASITMMFMGFSSAYIIRQGFAPDWQALGVPSALLASTVALIISSLTLELARRALKQGKGSVFKQWLAATALLGVGFLIGQVLACQQLMAKGIYLSTNPHSSFFYLLTIVHGLHLLGGLIAMSYVVIGAWRNRFAPGRQVAVDVTSLYWHFMDLLWIYLFLLLFVWR